MLKNKWRTHAEALCRVPRPPALRCCLLSRAGPNHQQNKSQIKREAWQAAKILTTTWRGEGAGGGGDKSGKRGSRSAAANKQNVNAGCDCDCDDDDIVASDFQLFFIFCSNKSRREQKTRRKEGSRKGGGGATKVDYVAALSYIFPCCCSLPEGVREKWARLRQRALHRLRFLPRLLCFAFRFSRCTFDCCLPQGTPR